jgi:hypothetical protein
MTAPVTATVETLAVQLAALDRRLTDALTARDRENEIRVEELAMWRSHHNDIIANSDRVAARMLPKQEYDERHKALEAKIDSIQQSVLERHESNLKFVMQRLDNMDRERNAIKIDVTTLIARAGYISAGFMLAIIAVIISLGGVWVDFVHPIVAAKP